MPIYIYTHMVIWLHYDVCVFFNFYGGVVQVLIGRQRFCVGFGKRLSCGLAGEFCTARSLRSTP